MAPKNIILLHGWGAGIKKLGPLGDALKKNGWKVLIPELPGFDAPEPPDNWGIDEYTEYVAMCAKIAFAGKPYFVFGHSFGGRIAIALSLRSHKTSSQGPGNLTGVVLCATGGISRGLRVKRIFFQFLAKIGKLLHLGGLWRALLYKFAREHDYEKSSPKMKEVFKKIVKEDLKTQVPKISLPTLVLWGQKDKITPVSDAYFLADNLQKKDVVVFEDQGHRLPYEMPKEIAKTIEKWAKNLFVS